MNQYNMSDTSDFIYRNYFNDEVIETEVNTMTKTLYDPDVERWYEKKVLVNQF